MNKLIKLCLMALTALPLSAVAQSQTKLVPEDFTISKGETKELYLDVENPDMEVTLVQFDMTLPQGLSFVYEDDELVADIERTTYKKHSLDYNELDGFMRFLLSSSSNKTLSGNSGRVLTITLAADSEFEEGTIVIDNILLVSPENTKEHEVLNRPEKIEIKILPAGIQGVIMDKAENGPVYNLQGVRVDEMSKGVYITNGKKVLVK